MRHRQGLSVGMGGLGLPEPDEGRQSQAGASGAAAPAQPPRCDPVDMEEQSHSSTFLHTRSTRCGARLCIYRIDIPRGS